MGYSDPFLSVIGEASGMMSHDKRQPRATRPGASDPGGEATDLEAPGEEPQVWRPRASSPRSGGPGQAAPGEEATGEQPQARRPVASSPGRGGLGRAVPG